MKRLCSLVAVAVCIASACTATSNGSTSDSGTVSTTRSVRASDSLAVAEPEVVVRGGLGDGWSDYGWAASVPAGGPITLDLGNFGGWIAANPNLAGPFGMLSIRVRAPVDLGTSFLSVRLSDEQSSPHPTAIAEFVPDDSGALSADLSVADLLDGGQRFDRIVLQASQSYPIGTAIVIDEVLLYPAQDASASTGQVAGSVDCAADARPISPHIYGVAFRSGDDQVNDAQWQLAPASRRWGGNPTSRYNWQSGHWWNTAEDYFFRNVEVLPGPTPAHEVFVRDNWAHGAGSAITVPMLGWVSKDASSYSFPLQTFGPQQSNDPDTGDAGNGLSPRGGELTPLPPTQTSVASDPASIGRWVSSLLKLAADNGRTAPFMYFLDNEPELWHVTHRDVRTTPIGYDELLQTSIAYASAIRAADPDALIAGPSPWGWPAYFYSAIDAEDGFGSTPDHDQHDEQGFIEWYLDQMRLYEQRTGVRLLDVLDVHYYPQNGVFDGGSDRDTAALRIRSTRALWDPEYRDESWIDENVDLIHRMKGWVDQHYPGTKLSIGEYNFGGTDDMSGALAQAEVLGRFGQEGLFSAYYWSSPPDQSPVYWAFRAFRNFDGAGGQFGDLSLEAKADSPVSVFASASTTNSDKVVIVVNPDPDEAMSASFTLNGCDVDSATAFSYFGGANGLEPSNADLEGPALTVQLAPYSITVVRLSAGSAS